MLRALSAASEGLPTDAVEPAVAIELADLERWHGHALTVLDSDDGPLVLLGEDPEET